MAHGRQTNPPNSRLFHAGDAKDNRNPFVCALNDLVFRLSFEVFHLKPGILIPAKNPYERRAWLKRSRKRAI